MIKKLFILFIILTSIGSTIKVEAQYLDLVCTGTTRVYRLAKAEGSSLKWSVNGGIMRHDWNDSIEVEWNNVGVYTIEVVQTDINGCKVSTSAQVQVGSQPQISLGNNTYLCKGKTLTLDAGIGFVNYYWNNLEGGQTLTISTSGKYKVTAYDSNGCMATDSVEIVVVNNPVVDLGEDLFLCGEETKTLDAGPDGQYYNWSNNASGGRQNTAYAVKYPEILKVKVTNGYGCSTSDSIVLNPCDYSKFAQYIPNTFTPGDNNKKNDTWQIPWLMQNFPNARVEIFDRWGQSVYLSTNGLPAGGWDGRRNGKLLPTDSYYYVIDLRNGSKPITGTVTIVR